jgi:hypothetical protein
MRLSRRELVTSSTLSAPAALVGANLFMAKLRSSGADFHAALVFDLRNQRKTGCSYSQIGASQRLLA